MLVLCCGEISYVEKKVFCQKGRFSAYFKVVFAAYCYHCKLRRVRMEKRKEPYSFNVKGVWDTH